MREALDRFFAHLSADGATPANTLKAYRTDLTQLLTFLTERGLTEAHVLHFDDLQAFCAWLQGYGYATATIARRMGAEPGCVPRLIEVPPGEVGAGAAVTAEVGQHLGIHAVALRVRWTRLRKRLQDAGVVADWL